VTHIHERSQLTNQVQREDRGVEAIDRAMNVLSFYSRNKGDFSLHELSELTGYYKSTLLRVLSSLEKAGIIHRRQDKKYVLGSEVMRLAAVYQHNFSLAELVRPVLKKIVDLTGESSSFFKIQGSNRICLVRENSPRGIRDHAMEGDVLPLDKGAAGRALSDFRHVLASDIPHNLSRALPYISYGELDQDMAGIAAPVFSSDKSLIGALAMSGPTSRFTSRAVTKFKPLILKSARELSNILGAHI
jgi:DNA-binding IclR family transcriptional regulator